MSKIALLHATEETKRNTVEVIVKESSPVPVYYLLLILSIIIVTLGLIINSEAIIIGGMVVSPLLSPILALGMGFVINDIRLLYRSSLVLLKSLAYVVGISIFVTLLSEFEPASQIISRTQPSLVYFYIAVASGVAAAFAYIKEEVQARIVGVAVAIALLPPLAVTGIGIALLDLKIVTGSLELFFVNFLGIVLACVIVFSLFGFYTTRKKAEQELQEESAQIQEYEKEKEEKKEEIVNELKGGEK
jgi:uncharacterized hydrophobic protein (TIGR00271 family)